MSTASCCRVSRDLSRNARASELVVSIGAAVGVVAIGQLRLTPSSLRQAARTSLGPLREPSSRIRLALGPPAMRIPWATASTKSLSFCFWNQ